MIQEPLTPQPLPKRLDIMFDAVTFTYPQSDTAALISVSFRVRARERVAIVGPSGAGKSTILALLLRGLDPQAGAIRIGGEDIKHWSLDELRSQISVVSDDWVLARAVLKDTPILLWEESPSNSDPASDRAIQAAWDELTRERTCIVIAHRLATVRRAHRILVLEKGRLIEQGRHTELLAQGGRYAQLHNAQPVLAQAHEFIETL